VTSKPLLIFDFDGVIVDGLNEYWWSSHNAVSSLIGPKADTSYLPDSVPQAFRELRPWVHQGWEMVLLAAELLRPQSPLRLKGSTFFSSNYESQCKAALDRWSFKPTQLQKAIDDVRRLAITNNKQAWLSLHNPFQFVSDRLKQLQNEGIEWAVLTTKSKDFTAELLDCFQLEPNLLFGHESGSKIKVLKQLITKRPILGFIEDRRHTLETVLNTPELSKIPCYLASWGYLKPNDKESLPQDIYLLKPETLVTPLATWH